MSTKTTKNKKVTVNNDLHNVIREFHVEHDIDDVVFELTDDLRNDTKSSILTDFVNHINDVDSNGNLLLGTKNNLREQLAKYGIMVNCKSIDYKPLDAYTRFDNNSQFQLLYSAKSKTFNGFNIRLCDKSHTNKFDFLNTVFTSCNDGYRIIKSDKITDFDLLPKTIETLLTLPNVNKK